MAGMLPVAFFVADCLAAAATGVVTTLGVRLLIPPNFDMVAAMMIGMAVGTIVHLLLSVVVGPLLGMFETMVPGMFVGMYGGMLFGMRDSMQHAAVPLGTAVWVGATFGVAVAVGIHLWNIQLRQASATGEASA
jgi:hypothetical protein